MSFDEIFDLTARVYLYFSKYFCFLSPSYAKWWRCLCQCRKYETRSNTAMKLSPQHHSNIKRFLAKENQSTHATDNSHQHAAPLQTTSLPIWIAAAMLRCSPEHRTPWNTLCSKPSYLAATAKLSPAHAPSKICFSCQTWPPETWTVHNTIHPSRVGI